MGAVEDVAREDMRDAWVKLSTVPPNDFGLDLFTAIGRLESYFGKGWRVSGFSAAQKQFIADRGLLIDEAKAQASNNWGAVQAGVPTGGVCSGTSFLWVDSHADGTPYAICERAYATAAEGAADIARILLKHPGIVAAAQAGDVLAFATAMKVEASYYELATDKYASRVLENANAIGGPHGRKYTIPAAVQVPPAPSGPLGLPWWAWATGGLSIGWGIWHWLTKR